MIFSDKVRVKLKEKKMVAGTMTTVVVFDGYTRGVVTTLKPESTFDSSTNKVNSRLRVFLAPFSERIKPTATATDLEMVWGPFTKISPDGMIEPQYLNGRLHHYEMFAIGTTN